MRALLVLTLFALLGACSAGEQPQGEFRPEAYRGQWLVVSYWARWCKPCIEEIPELNRLDDAFRDVAVVGVNFDGAAGEELRLQAEEMGISFILAERDPAAALGVQRPVVLPTTLVFRPDGELADTLVGPQTFEALATATGHDPQ